MQQQNLYDLLVGGRAADAHVVARAALDLGRRCALPARRALRDAARADRWTPIVVVSGNARPEVLGGRGGRGGWYTHGGVPVRHPGAYRRRGWSGMMYVRGDRHVAVGADWLRACAAGGAS